MSAERLHMGLLAFNAELPKATDPSQGRNLAVGRELDTRLVNTIIQEHSQLTQGQALVLTVQLANPDADYQELEGYEGFVHDGPIDFTEKLREMVAARAIEINVNTDALNFPPQTVDIVIPHNIYSDESLAHNSTASRDAVLSGRVRSYLRSTSVRTTWLLIKPTGMPWNKELVLHPSIIKDMRIEPLEEKVGVAPTVHVRVATEIK